MTFETMFTMVAFKIWPGAGGPGDGGQEAGGPGAQESGLVAGGGLGGT